MNNLQKMIAMDILECLGGVFKDPMLAGGAVRDYVLGRHASDLDIYVRSNLDPQFTVDTVLGLMQQGEFEHTRTVFRDDLPENYQGASLEAVIFGRVGEQEINIMCSTAPYNDAIIRGFPCNMSEAYMYLDGVARTTGWFRSGMERRRLVFTRHCKQAYKDKIIQKFPDWEVAGEDRFGWPLGGHVAVNNLRAAWAGIANA